MRPTALACPLDISEETLSAWRDGLLDPADSRQLEQHIADCDACQRRLSSFERVARVLSEQREPQLTAQVWRGLQRSMTHPGTSTRSASGITLGRVPPAAVAAVAAVLIVAMFSAAFAFRISRTPGSDSTGLGPASTATVTTTPAHTPTASGIPAGWTAASTPPGSLPDLAIAPSAPSVIYAVTITNLRTQSGGTVALSSSHDSGATWQALPSPATNQNRCSISVDPVDASDVVLVCTPGASSGFVVLRSFDGAKTWSQPQLGVTANCYDNMGWADSTLLMSLELCDSGSAQTQLIASVGKGPFKRLDTDGKVSGITLGSPIRLITGHSSTYDIQMGGIEYSEPQPPQLGDTLIETQDSGATWQTKTLADNGSAVHLLAVDPHDQNWVGVYGNAPTQLALSGDGGQTWHKLPRPWANEVGPDFLFVAPDGTVLVTDAGATYVNYTSPTFPLYEATPGAAQWRPAIAIPDPGSVFAHTACWDSNGHPTTLWASYASNAGDGAWYLISHPILS